MIAELERKENETSIILQNVAKEGVTSVRDFRLLIAVHLGPLVFWDFIRPRLVVQLLLLLDR